MIKDILVSLKEYITCKMPAGVNVTLDSVSRDKEAEPGDLVITLLRIEEETSRKPQNVYFTLDNGTHYPTSPDLNLNLEVLISSPAPKYETALFLVSEVIRILNSIKTVKKPKEMSDESFKLIDSMHISLMGMSFDQMLSMWQTLGGTLVPAVAYKIRMITIKGITDAEDAPIIGKGKVRVEMGRMDTKGKKPKTLSKKYSKTEPKQEDGGQGF